MIARVRVHLLVLLFLVLAVGYDTHRARTIIVNFHNVYGFTGFVNDDVFVKQLEIINKAYAPADLHFELGTIDHTYCPRWTLMLDYTDDTAYEMSEFFLSKPENDSRYVLNIFTVNFLTNPLTGERYVGASSFPWDNDPLNDRIFIDYQTLPNSGPASSRTTLGITSIHEIGHWAGLYHTFENGCNPPGDYVDDTPPEATAASSDKCEQGRKTCPHTVGVDPVDNYMDYSPDGCRKRFTQGQIARMKKMLEIYRPTL